MEFERRYKTLNAAQKQAVDSIDGPLLVVAGPGTGKTELLSMRVANILKKTDTAPQNILLLTFTESGASAMRERLTGIIGPDAYRVAIHTFHSFGTEVINQNREYFYNGAQYQPSDEITSYEALESIFDTLDYANPLAVKNQGDYVYLPDTVRTISELKTAGLTSDELLQVLDANDLVLDSAERQLTELFSLKVSLKMTDKLAEIAQKVATMPQPALPAGITPLANVLALSLAHAVDSALQINKTTPLTAWRNEWLEKDSSDQFVFKDRKRTAKLRAVAYIYFAYLSRMDQDGLYDYDDMVLQVVHAMETRADLCANLREKYSYVLVDEFQDTNLAQLRLLMNLAPDDNSNIMAVGDDDQAIYSFQGADINNIHKFRLRYPAAPIMVLTDNYRSTPQVLAPARQVITQGQERLEDTIAELTKELTAHQTAGEQVELYALGSPTAERDWLAEQVANSIKQGVKPGDIAIIARRHAELMALVPHLRARDISVNYERRDNVLENELVHQITTLADTVLAIHEQRLDDLNALLPEVLSYPAFGFSPQSVWQLSLAAYAERTPWPQVMQNDPIFKPIINWLINLSGMASTAPLEIMLDTITGLPDTPAVGDFRSPLFMHYFGADISGVAGYLQHLSALRTIRSKLRDYAPQRQLILADFLHYINLHLQTNTGITSVGEYAADQNAVTLLTAHKSKGLEYPSVYIIGATDNAWGEKVRIRSRLISYPRNLGIAPAGDTPAERLRLFYVAMTRAKQHLTISYSTAGADSRAQLPASFLSGTSLSAKVVPATPPNAAVLAATLDWHNTLTAPLAGDLAQLLAPVLANFKLSVTALHNFTDVTKGGPRYFLLNNLLRFPSAKSPSAQYGTAIHATLQHVHNQLISSGRRRPVEDILHQFEHALSQQRLTPPDHEFYLKKGLNSLTKFLESHYNSFTKTQKTELSFANQGVILHGARLTGNLDLVDINDQAITVTDYKTGTPAESWKGSSEYDKIKLHKYRQQLMFYQLLVAGSRDYAKYAFNSGILQFVEPNNRGEIHALNAQFSASELAQFSQLIAAVWQSIMALDLPEITGYSANLKGILSFEQTLLDKYPPMV